MNKHIKFRYNILQRTFLYALAGGAGVALDISLFTVLTYFNGSTLPLVFANIVGYCSGTLLSYTINRKLTMRSATHSLSFARFFSVALLGLATSTAIISMLVLIGKALFDAKIAATLVVVVVQYFFNSTLSLKSNARQYP